MKKLRRVLKKLSTLMTKQVEQQEKMLGEMRRHNELMAKSLALNAASLGPVPAPSAVASQSPPPAKPKRLPPPRTRNAARK